LDVKRKQCAADTRSVGAFTGIRLVKRAVCPAPQKSVVVGEELVRPPIERCAGMDAIVDIGVVAPTEVDDETFDKPLSPHNVKLRRSTRWDFSDRRRPHRGVSDWIPSSADRSHPEHGIAG
jgi:hypothetical protein